MLPILQHLSAAIFSKKACDVLTQLIVESCCCAQGEHDDTVAWSPSRCCTSANCSPLAGSSSSSQLPPPPPLTVDDCVAQFRPSVDSCSSDTYEDQPDDNIVAFSEEVDPTLLRGEEGIEEEEGEEVFSVDIENELDIDEIEND